MHSSPYLRYSPPSYHSYGLPPTQSDPFEMNTVEVNYAETLIIGHIWKGFATSMPSITFFPIVTLSTV